MRIFQNIRFSSLRKNQTLSILAVLCGHNGLMWLAANRALACLLLGHVVATSFAIQLLAAIIFIIIIIVVIIIMIIIYTQLVQVPLKRIFYHSINEKNFFYFFSTDGHLQDNSKEYVHWMM